MPVLRVTSSALCPVDKLRTQYMDVHLGHLDEAKVIKPDLKALKVTVISPDGSAQQIEGALADVGYVVGRFPTKVPGVHTLLGVQDKVVDYEPARAIRCEQAFVLATGKPQRSGAGKAYGAAYHQPLEIIPDTDPLSLRAGGRFSLCLLYEGQPLPDAQVELIGRHRVAKRTLRTDANGRALIRPLEPGWFLAVADHEDRGKRGENYEFTKLSATLPLVVQPSVRQGEIPQCDASPSPSSNCWW